MLRKIFLAALVVTLPTKIQNVNRTFKNSRNFANLCKMKPHAKLYYMDPVLPLIICAYCKVLSV